MEIKIPGIDTDKGLYLCDGDIDIYLSILRTYNPEMLETLKKIRNVSEETLRDYTVRVHGAKSISEAVGAEEIRKTAKQLEEMGKSGDLAGILALNDTFINNAEKLADSIKIWFEHYDASH